MRRYPNTEYKRVNERYFGNRLPKYRVRWKPDEEIPLLRGLVDFEKREIYLNSLYKSAPKIWYLVLLHEMEHIEQDMIAPRSADHGRVWAKIMRRLAADGAMDEAW